ncbi:methionine--tRNA ligase [bacterium]|nr:methionine--tRNA ligase [bacterium]
MAKRHLITSALPYANGPIHIGHLVGCLLPADTYNRYLKMMGEESLFVCGTDEHGVPITLKARKEGKTPQQVVDENHEIIKNALVNFGIEFDHFSRTTNKIHHETARDFFKVLLDNGSFNEEVSAQFYDEEAKQFLADRYIVGNCPNCDYDNAYGDQCERCGKSLSPNELINPKSALTGSAPVLKETKNWYLPLDKIQEEFLNEFIEGKKGQWRSTVYGQCMSWLKEGLKPRAMTRDLDWGVPVPADGAEGKVMYVWFDAPIGYISATKEVAGEQWKKWWLDQETELTHFLGKDNIVFHCLIFPAMLHQHGDFILPTNVPANEFLNLEGQKISTSRDHAIWLHDYNADFPNRRDELRYVLTSIMPETKDADFTWADYQAKVNNELVAILGNFINRVMVLTHKYFDGIIPEATLDPEIKQLLSSVKGINESMGRFNQREALGHFMDIARAGNAYLQNAQPWHLIKDEANLQQVKDCLFTCLHIVKEIGSYSRIFLPDSSNIIISMLNLQNYGHTLSAGHKIGAAQLLFNKVEDAEIDAQREKLVKKQKENKPKEKKAQKEMIQFDDFTKLDLRVGTITEAEKVEKADKLLKLTVDIGDESRTVVSGIAEHFKAEDIKGKQVTLLVNLAPRKLRGIESQGMILMAEDENGKLVFVNPDEAVSPGSGIS